jgi:hypothetical protein
MVEFSELQYTVLGLAKSDFDLFVHFYLKHFLTGQYDIFI